MDILQVIILGIVEGFTEFLPISSTAHQILASHILSIAQTDFLSSFEIVIQIGAIAAVAVVFYKRIMANKALLYKACIGFIPTGILGFILIKHIKNLLHSDLVPVITLFVGGIIIILLEVYFKKSSKSKVQSLKTVNNERSTKNLAHLTYKDAVTIGLIQSISMIPGVSRSAASIFGGMALRLDRESAVEFSFLLALPTMVAATGLDLVKSGHSFNQAQIIDLILGTAVSFIVALIVIKWLLKYVQKHDFIGFGIYRIVLSILYFLLFIR